MASLHPAATVTNIRNFIPIVLEMDDGQYTSWVELFKIHCRAHEVIHLILPEEASPSYPTGDKDKEKVDDVALQKRLDSIVLQWIYDLRMVPLIMYHLKNLFLVKNEKDREHAMDPGSLLWPITEPRLPLYFLG